MSDRTFYGLILVVLLALGIFYGWPAYQRQQFLGDWRASFRLDPEQKNIDRVEFLRLAFYPNNTCVYEIKSSNVYNDIMFDARSTSASRGFTRSTKRREGTFHVGWDRIYVTLPADLSYEMRFDPFVVEDFGTDHTTGKSFVKLSLKVRRESYRLIIQGFAQGPEIAMSTNEDGFGNDFRFPLADNAYLAAQTKPRGEIVKVEKYIDGQLLQTPDPVMADKIRRKQAKMNKDLIGDQYQYKNAPAPRAKAEDAPAPHYIPYVPKEGDAAASLNQPSSQTTEAAAAIAAAKSKIRYMSTASEAYATANSGQYPSTVTDLTSAVPPYLINSDCDRTVFDFDYACEFSPSRYKMTATSQKYDRVITIATGGVMDEQKLGVWGQPDQAVNPEQISAEDRARLHNVHMDNMRRKLILIADKAEAFATANGRYPNDLTELSDFSPTVCPQQDNDFTYSCQFSSSTYELTATSTENGSVYAMTTGKNLVQRK
jgi:hypothetical protein